MARRDRSAEAVAREYVARWGLTQIVVGDLANVIRKERARVRRIVRKLQAGASYTPSNPEAYGRYLGIHNACTIILAALREGKGTR